MTTSYLSPAIERATAADFDAVRRLLGAAGLPLDGVEDPATTFFVARAQGEVVGTAAVEAYADGVLLRSVAVAATFRGRGLGERLTEAALDHARAVGSRQAFLLTTTAAAYFPRLGFEIVTRTDVPPGVAGSVEFTSACPASATVMRAPLA